MKFTFSRAAAPAAMVLAASLLTVSAAADEPEKKAQEAQEQADDAKSNPAASVIVIPEVKEDKRICRKVKLDMSSRRGTRVCKTKAEWRDFNQRR